MHIGMTCNWVSEIAEAIVQRLVPDDFASTPQTGKFVTSHYLREMST
jgi:hypothetical protein